MAEILDQSGTWTDKAGHVISVLDTKSSLHSFVLVNCASDDVPMITQTAIEFTFIVHSSKDGYFILGDQVHPVTKGDIVSITTNTPYSFGGCLEMLLTYSGEWAPEQEIVEQRTLVVRPNPITVATLAEEADVTHQAMSYRIRTLDKQLSLIHI